MSSIHNDHITFKAKLVSKHCEKAIGNITREVDLTHVQSFILGYIHEHKDSEICQRDIEHKFNITHPTVTGILKRLEEKGFITCVPSEKDRRFKIIKETDKAEKLHVTITNAIENAENEVTSCLTDDEKETLSALLDKILSSIYSDCCSASKENS